MLPEDVGLRLSAAAAGVQTERQVRPGRNDTSLQAQLSAVRRGLRAPDTGKAPGRFRLFQVARLQQRGLDLHVEAGLRLQATDQRAVESSVRRRARLPRHVGRDHLQLLSRGLPTLHHFQNVHPDQIPVRRRRRLSGRSRRTQLP